MPLIKAVLTDGHATVAPALVLGSHRARNQLVVDLNGEHAVFTVGEFNTVDPALTAEARAVFDSVAFERDRSAGGQGSPTPTAGTIASNSTAAAGFEFVTADPDTKGLARVEQSVNASQRRNSRVRLRRDFPRSRVFAVWQAASDPAMAQHGGARKLLDSYLLSMGVST